MKTKPFGPFSPGDTDMPAYPDEQLVLEALDDSNSAFGQLVKQYQYRVLRTIASIISDREAAQDVAQETFLSAWSDLAKLKEREKFGRWLNQIAINLSKNWLRDQRKHNEDKVPLDENAVVLTQELRYQRDKLRHEVWEAIDELSEDHREAVVLHYISGYSYKEIGEMLSVPFSTVSGRLQKAKDQLRKEFLDMVSKLQLEIDSTVHKFLKEHAKENGVSIESLIIRLIERYKMDIDKPEIAVRRVWGPGSGIGGPTSPDGRYQSFTNWSSSQGDLAIRDHTTGECRDLTDEATWMGPDQCAGGSTWSPDGNQIAYRWSKFENPDESENRNELRIVKLNGSKPRVLYGQSSEAGGVNPHAWSQDGKFILTCLGKKGGPEIVLISVTDGSVRVLKSGQPRPIRMDISPDGRYVVYDYSVDHYSPRDIFLLATDGSGEEVPLVEHPANDYGPVWAPDGKSIVFVSDRGGSYGTWLLQMADGKPVGEPQLVKRDTGAMYSMGFTRNGSLYYSLDAGQENIYVATLDPSTGELAAPPTKISHTFEGFNTAPAWSPDGKYLAYRSRRWPVPGGIGMAVGMANRVLVILSMETGEERVFPARNAILRKMRWSPDGRSILCSTDSREYLRAVVDAQTGDVTLTVPRDAAKRRGQVLQAATGRKGGYRSPDGRQSAFKSRRGISVAPVEGGEPREILKLKDGEEFAYIYCGLAWIGDGRYILFGKLQDRQHELWSVPVEGGEPKKLLAMADGLSNLAAHPDGRRIAFTGGGRHMSEVWVMENFLQRFAAHK